MLLLTILDGARDRSHKRKPFQVDKKDLTSSDPYLKIARVLETGEQTYVFKTEVQKRTLNPVWKEIQVFRLCVRCGELNEQTVHT